MEEPILIIRDLTVRYAGAETNAVHTVSLDLNAGESVGLIGESGSGKSSLALSVMALLDKKAHVDGKIIYKGVDLVKLAEKEMDRCRWAKVAIVFQNSLDVFNPVLTIGEQIAEGVRRHLGASKQTAMEKTQRYLELVGLETSWAKAYPHQLSGGMRQKALVAMALSCEPECSWLTSRPWRSIRFQSGKSSVCFCGFGMKRALPCWSSHTSFRLSPP